VLTKEAHRSGAGTSDPADNNVYDAMMRFLRQHILWPGKRVGGDKVCVMFYRRVMRG